MIIDYIGESTSKGYFDGIDHIEYAVPSIVQGSLGVTINNLAKDSVSVDWFLGIKDGDESLWEPDFIGNPLGTTYELAKSKSNIVVINLGINDSVNSTIDEFTKDFRQLVDNCLNTGKVTYVIIPNEINGTLLINNILNLNHVRYIESGKVPLCDNYHPTQEGYLTIADKVSAVIKNDLNDIENHKIAVGMYIAMFNQAPEKEGLDYWANELNYKTVDQVAESVVDATESYVGLISNNAFISMIYTNLLNREPDAEGFNYWLNEIALTDRGTVMNRIINVLESDYCPQVDQVTFQNKVSVGMSNGYVYENDFKVDLIGVTSDFETVYNY